MATFRRAYTPGATYFFTVATYGRQPLLIAPPVIAALRAGLKSVRQEYPFEIVAFVVLPDHLHAVWMLPQGDSDYSCRWAMLKRFVSQRTKDLVTISISTSLKNRNEAGLWQRRFWEHQIRDESDLQRHVDYIHFNPVKHGVVAHARDWPHSTFHRYVKQGWLPSNWGSDIDEGAFGE